MDIIKPHNDDLKGRVIKLIEEDREISDAEAINFKEAINKKLLPESVALAWQLRHNNTLIFTNRAELEQVAAQLYGQHVPQHELLYSTKRVEQYEKSFGASINQVLARFCNGEKPTLQEDVAKQVRLKDYLDKVLSNAYKMNVFELEAAFRLSENGIQTSCVASPKVKTQLRLLEGHLKRARTEVIRWQKRGFRTSNTIFDRMLGREFHPAYKLPEKELLRTPEGKAYIKGIKKTPEKGLSEREAAYYRLARAQFILLTVLHKNELLIENANAVPKVLIDDVNQSEKKRLQVNGEKNKNGEMRLSELRFNIQDGENRIVPGMSKKLIDASQRLTDVMVNPNNPQNINPIGKNPIAQERINRGKEYAERQAERLVKGLNPTPSKSQGWGIKRKKD